MNNVKLEKGLLSSNILNSIHIKNSLQPHCSQIKKESAFKCVNSVKYENEQCQNNQLEITDCSEVIQTDDDKNLIDKNTEKNKKFTDIFSEDVKALKEKTLKGNTIKPLKLNNTIDPTKIVVSCRFCRKGFDSFENLISHDCKKKNKCQKLHKCKFCLLTFTEQSHLRKHILNSHKMCNICNAQFVTRKILCKHLKTEHQITEPEKLYHCQFCSKYFTKKQSLNIHLKSHDGHQYFCLKCGFGSNDEVIYKNHIVKHINYECNLCGQRFARHQQYEQHMMCHKRYSCTSCNVTYSTKNLFSRHQLRVHHIPLVQKKHTCPVCDKAFFRPKLLQIHQRTHTKEKVTKCFQCEKSFRDEKSLEKHMQTMRHLQRVNNNKGQNVEIEKRYLCSRCGATFTQQQSLFRHMKIIHLDSQSFKCPYCEYNTKSKTNFNRHLEFHKDTKSFVCEICGSSFRAFDTLKQHQTFVHSENREFICDVCNKGFKSKSTLLRHLRIHSENRPYKCHCDKSYKRMSHLKRHMISAHNMTFKKNQIVTKNSNLGNANDDETFTPAVLESLEGFSNHSSSDNFSVSSMSNNNVACMEQSDSDTYKNEEGNLYALNLGDNNFINVPLNTSQAFLDKTDFNITTENSKNTSENAPTTNLKTISMSLLPDSQASISLDDLNLNLSNNYCNLNLPSSPLERISVENITSTLSPSIMSQDVLSLSSPTDSLIRPQSLPNLNFQTHSSNIDSFAHFSMQNSDVPTAMEIPSFLLSGDISSPSHVTGLNLEENNSSKQLFEDSDILSLPPYPTSNELGESNCSTDHFFNSTRDVDFWVTGDNNNKIKVYDSDLVTTSTCAKTTFSNSLSSNSNSLLSNNLIFPNDSLMSCSLDADTFNSEFDALSNLC